MINHRRQTNRVQAVMQLQHQAGLQSCVLPEAAAFSSKYESLFPLPVLSRKDKSSLSNFVSTQLRSLALFIQSSAALLIRIPASQRACVGPYVRGSSQMPPSTTGLLQWSNPPSPPHRMSLLPHTGEIINSFYCIYLLANNSIKACRRPPSFCRLANAPCPFSRWLQPKNFFLPI